GSHRISLLMGLSARRASSAGSSKHQRRTINQERHSRQITAISNRAGKMPALQQERHSRQITATSNSKKSYKNVRIEMTPSVGGTYRCVSPCKLAPIVAEPALGSLRN